MVPVNIALHLFSTIIIWILLISSSMEKRIDSHVPQPLLLMMLLNLVMLISYPLGELIIQKTHSDNSWVLLLKSIHHLCFYAIYYEFLVYLMEAFSQNLSVDRKLLISSIPIYLLCTFIWIAYSVCEKLPLSQAFRSILWFGSRYGGITVPILTAMMFSRCRSRMDRHWDRLDHR